ncbi:MAG: TlpA family protein disulfide reductase, partial [Bacteroidales bacterium]|nr:TlpA family protein disulfide reductase [Bacteroidales bacterium]
AGGALKSTEAFQINAERLTNMKTSLPGFTYKDIQSKDAQGNPCNLSDYAGKGKYVLLDFWASWCPPCREEMPNLVKLYSEYKDKNFEIVGYSLDKKEDAWKKGIQDLQMTWPQLSDCEYWNSLGVRTYAVQSIPCTVLIAPDGTIIERGLSGEALAEKIKSLIQ